jgi:hypothetical protein
MRPMICPKRASVQESERALSRTHGGLASCLADLLDVGGGVALGGARDLLAHGLRHVDRPAVLVEAAADEREARLDVRQRDEDAARKAAPHGLVQRLGPVRRGHDEDLRPGLAVGAVLRGARRTRMRGGRAGG